MHDEEYKLFRAEASKFDKWRNRANKHIPTLSARIFALRDKNYVGWGFHYSLEKKLGYIILKFNDFDNRPTTSRDMWTHRVIMEVHLDGLFKDVVKAEKSIHD